MNFSQSPVKANNARAQMDQRIANGEFGMPADVNKVNDAWSQLVEQGPKTVYHPVCPLWIKEGLNDPSKKVLFECNRTREQVIIPAGVKMLVLKTPLPKKNNTQPDANMVYVTEEY
jgi:hypothetical protein